MAFIAKVKSTAGRLVQAVAAGKYALTARSAGDDAPPMEGDRLVLVRIEGTGDHLIAGVVDGVDSSVEAGERKLYSRDASGSVAATLYLRRDGTIVLNDNCVINTDGTILAPDIKLGIAQLSILSHIHTTPSGPSGPPQVGGV